MEENIKFVKAAVLEALILNGYASGSAVAWVMYQKFANAMPLYRQEQDWQSAWSRFYQGNTCQLDHILCG
jgi:hypothetical protein